MAKCNLRVHALLRFSLPRPDSCFYHPNSERVRAWAYYSLKYAYFLEISLWSAFLFFFFFYPSRITKKFDGWRKSFGIKSEWFGGKVGHVGYSVWKPVQAAPFDWWSFSFLGLKCTKMEKARGSLRPYFIWMLFIGTKRFQCLQLETAAGESVEIGK